MPLAVLDTDVFSYLHLHAQHRKSDWSNAYKEFLDEQGIGNDYAISTITCGEILDGIIKNKIGLHREEVIREAMASTTILPVTVDTAQAYADFAMPKGLSISVNDRWIGATSLEHNIPLVSNDQVFKSATQINLRTLSLT